MCLSDLMVKTLVRKTGDLRFKSQLKHKFFSIIIIYMTILQPLHRFTYVTAHSSTLPPLYLRHRSFFSPSVASPTSQTLHLRHSSFSNPFATSSTPQLILQPFRRFTYVTGYSSTLTLLHLRHRHFTYFTWRPAQEQGDEKQSVVEQLVTANY